MGVFKMRFAFSAILESALFVVSSGLQEGVFVCINFYDQSASFK